MLGRGRGVAATAKTCDRSERTIKRWTAGLPGFAEEIERVRASAAKPDPRGTLIDSLSATRDDRVDWQSRIAGAKALLATGYFDQDEDGPVPTGPTITVLPAIPPPS